MKALAIFLFAFLLLFGCVQETVPQELPEENPMSDNASETVPEPEVAELPKETVYATFSDRDFSVIYPDWVESTYSDNSILVRQRGPCILNVDRHNTSLDQLFNWIVNYTTSEENVTLHDIDLQGHSLTFQAPFQNISYKAKYLFRYCNYETYVIGATCAEGFWDSEQEELDKYLASAECAKVYEEPDYGVQYSPPSLEDTVLARFVEEDYSVQLPEWNEIDVGGEETIVALAYGPCATFLNKYNSPSDNLYGWMDDYIESNDSLNLIHKDVPAKQVIYDSTNGNVTMRTNSRIIYCNYQSYYILTMCEKEYYLDNSDVLESIVDSAKCAREYAINPEIADLEVPPPPEEERIVETDAGAEYGINAEAVVAFFNTNPIFLKIMKNYDKVNLRIIDEEDGVDIRLKAKLKDGLITNVKDGEYSDADFTLIMPLDDALNIFNNADNITLLNFLGFIKNVKTDPPVMLNQLIRDAFKP
ncbi:MAG: hypothetical protein ABII71_03600 [Candidatus Micrarchaeota archaeon]